MSFVAHYRQHLTEGYHPDPAQLVVAERLNELGTRLLETASRSRWRRALDLLPRRNRPRLNPIGLYIWGGVGRGKTFLMDLFFAWLPMENKQRLHFHHFMQLVHTELHRIEGQPNPLREFARSFREKTRLLCFDEFFVTDIGDAMILAELLDALIREGVVLVATSNTKPSLLYENGLQRSRFMPAIRLIEEHTQVLEIGGERDYRLEALHQGAIYRLQYPAPNEVMETDRRTLLWRPFIEPKTLTINGRELSPLYHGEGTAGFTFHELCETPRNANDYIELARLFHTIVLYDIPTMDGSADSAARRFIALIDEFYDRNVNVIFYAEAPIHQLYGGDQLAQGFERTVSRVIEMQADAYLTAAHKA